MKADAPKGEVPVQKSLAEEIFLFATQSMQKKGTAEKAVPTWILRSLVERSAPVRACIEIVGREVTRSTKYYDRCWDLYPKQSLGEDGIKPDDPKRKEYAALEQLLLAPDRRNRRTMNHLIKAAVTDLLTYDDFFWSIAYGDDGMPGAIYAEDAGNILIRYDKKGNVGDDTYFCDQCPPELEYFEDEAKRHGMQCPHHHIPLKKTAYVQFIESAGKVTARWAENEMVHGHLFKVGSRLNGLPLLLSLMLPIGNMLLMDQWFNDSYQDQRLPKGMLVFKGTPNDAVQRTATQVESAVAKNPHAAAWVGLGENKDVQFIKLMDTPTEMQSLDWYKLYRDVVYQTFNVAPAVGGIIESGRAGQQPDMQRATNANFIAAIQACIAETITNSPLFEVFGVKNWYFGFAPSEEEDELMEAQTSQAWATAAAQWKMAGYDTALDEDGRIYPTEKSPVPEAPGPSDSEFSGLSPPANEIGPGPGQTPDNAFEAPLKGAWNPEHYYGLIEQMLVKGGLTPRKIPRSEAIAGLRSDELAFYDELEGAYKGIIDRGIKELNSMKGASEAQVRVTMDRILGELRGELMKAAERSVERLYMDGMREGGSDLGLAVDFGAEEKAAVGYIMSAWPGVNSVLPEFTRIQQDIFGEIISKNFRVPGEADWRAMVQEMRKASDSEVWKLARIARSEATLIANQGRAAIYRKADKGEPDYDWVAAPDACVKCADVAARGPWKLEDLMNETDGGRIHPNDRCTFVKRPIHMRAG